MIFLYFLILALLCTSAKSTCKNNTDIRYDLKAPVQMTNYYSVCSEYTGRTCCSPNNIQALVKKYMSLYAESKRLSTHMSCLPSAKKRSRRSSVHCAMEIG